MELNKAELDFISEKHEGGERLSLEEVMMLYYKKPCRRVFPHSNDPVITGLKATRGSVLVTEEEVVVVCNPLDFHLLAPSPDFTYGFKEPSEFLIGTTIITCSSKGEVHVSYIVGSVDRCNGLPEQRWGGAMLSGSEHLSDREMLFTKSSYNIPGGHLRMLTCVEEVSVLGSFSGKRLLRSFKT